MLKKVLSIGMAAVMVVGSLTSCGKKDEVSSVDGGVTLKWYIRGSEPVNLDSVAEKANEYTMEKLGITVDYKFIDPTSYDEKMNLIMSSGEEYDICFTSNWSNDYVSHARDGAFAELDKYLPEYPELMATMPEHVWESSKVDGRYYSIFNYQCIAIPNGWWFRKDLIDKYNIDLSNVDTMAEFTEIFKIIKDKEPGMICAHYGDAGVSLNSESENKLPPYKVGGFFLDQDTMQLKEYANVSKEMEKHYELMREWYENDFFSPDIATLVEADLSTIKAGRVFSGFTSLMPGAESEIEKNYGFDIETVKLHDAYMTAAIGCNNAISAKSRYIKESLEFLQLLNTDKYLYNLLQYGIEGQDYDMIDTENEIIRIRDGEYKVDTFVIGSKANSYTLEGKDPNVWAITEEINNNAAVNPYSAFSFNPNASNVSAQYAQVQAVDSEYRMILKNGLDEPAKVLEEYRAKLKKAGIDDVRIAVQEQFDKWCEENGKK